MSSTPSASSGAQPVCPRHPDTVSYVRCQRCGRPACARCQVPAAVGVHCVDCVREQQRSAPQVRTALGGRARGGPPVITYALIALSIAAYVLQRAVPGFTSEMWFVPLWAAAEPYRFLSSAFVHSPSSILHIGFNLYALWIVGPFLEAMLGRARFLTLYLLSALGGSAAVLLLTNTPDDVLTPVVGASGAIFGLFAAVLIVMRRLGRAATQIFIVIALNIVIGFVVPGISWQGHMGGLVVGAILGAVFAWAPRERRLSYAVLGSALALALLVGTSIWKMSSIGLI